MKNLNSGLFCNKKVNFTEKQKTFDMNFFLNDGRWMHVKINGYKNNSKVVENERYIFKTKNTQKFRQTCKYYPIICDQA